MLKISPHAFRIPILRNVTECYEHDTSITTACKILLTPIPLKVAYKCKYFSYTFISLIRSPQD
jgi:hypothetical protein